MKILLIFNSHLFSNSASSNIFRRFLNSLNFDITYILIGRVKKNTIKKNVDIAKVVVLNSFIFSRIIMALKKRIKILKKLICFYEYEILPLINYFTIKYKLNLQGFDKIWVFSCFETLPTAYYLIKKLNYYVHFSIHDDIPDNFEFFKKIADKKLVYFFKEIIKKSESLDLISEYMLIEYKKKYDISSNSFSIWGGFNYIKNTKEVDKFDSLISNLFFEKHLKIIYGSSISTIDEHEIFWKTLIKIKDKFNFNITLDYYIPNFYLKLFKRKPDFVKINHIIEEDRFIRILKNYDFGFVTMSFKKEYAFATKVAFPSKVNTFLGSKLILISIAPEYSSVYKFINYHKIGICSSRLNEDDLFEKIKNVLFNKELLKEFYNNIENVLENELNYEKGINKFKQIFISEKEN